MNTPVLTPSLLNQGASPEVINAPTETRTLLDLMYDGFHLLFLLKNHILPTQVGQFAGQISKFLLEFEKNAKRRNVPAEDIFDAKYAFCAAIDETIMRSNSSIRDHWERNPLQLTLFGHQLAGETFFTKLDELRTHASSRMEVLEVFHMCLLLGFQGKYLLEGPEKLAYLTARIGDDIAASKGKRAAFAPHWAIPDHVVHRLARVVPPWVTAAAMGCFSLLGFLGLMWSLQQKTETVTTQYGGIVKLAPNVAHITITLP